MRGSSPSAPTTLPPSSFNSPGSRDDETGDGRLLGMIKVADARVEEPEPRLQAASSLGKHLVETEVRQELARLPAVRTRARVRRAAGAARAAYAGPASRHNTIWFDV